MISARQAAAELLGTAALLAVVVGSGVMGERLSGGNAAVALLANALATGCGLYVLITVLGPVSGAHFNPAVTLVAWQGGELPAARAVAFMALQVTGAIAGVLLAHAMFDLPLLQVGDRIRTGTGQWLSELVATLGLLATIRGFSLHAPAQVAVGVAAYITAAYWFTASTSFANPAVTLARSLTTTFAGIAPSDAPGFIAAQLTAVAFFIAAVRLLRPR